uniref:NADH-ubiquinone oxidoreductase chain 6 n=1 Tax=Dorysthenes paradoxus TaxID=690276 RepID=A0A3P8MSG5_9CUCU|nr:NADH dehydrogenase subunit 6 [Dorysthenes paradoxus]AWI69844.1 NADH dehydrogenase subunit 6 [Dorysthenes paradoxus]
MMTMLISLLIALSLTFMFLNHPLSFGLILLLQTIAISLITGTMNYNYWFSYILFLIMVGGMLVLFIYMTSIASNEKFKFSPKITMMALMFLSMSMLTLMLMDKSIINLVESSYDLMNQNSEMENSKSMIKFFNYPMSSNTYMIIMYLLITLIMAVKITNIQYGPLRQKL